jgi:UDP-N-acetylmuramate dehydrogenase
MFTKRHGVRLAGETSIHIGGQAADFYVPASVPEFRILLADLADRNPFVLGGGCNILFPDETFERPIISTERLRRFEIGDHRIRAECGVRVGTLVRAAVEAGLGGLEGFVGIPGTVGGAVVMNAGGSGWSLGGRIEELGLLPLGGGELVRLPGKDVDWGYRSWNLEGYVVAWALFGLTPADTHELRKKSSEMFQRKRTTQPLGDPSSGCVFKNPPGRAAASMIDSLGLKGMRFGGAMVSESHANFIVNKEGRAKAEDVKRLIVEIRDRVETAYQVRLETEIVLADDLPP